MLILRNFLVLVLMTSLILSCSKDEKSVVGNWDFTSVVSTNCLDSDVNGTVNFTNGCFKESVLGFEIELCGTAVLTDKNYTFNSKTTIFGQVDNTSETGTYSISGDKITFTPTTGEKTEGTLNSDRNSLVINTKDDESGCDQVITLRKK